MPKETEKIAELSIPYGRWFVRGCRFVSDKFGAPPKKIEERENRAKERFREEEKRYNLSLNEFREGISGIVI